ncbi:MAG: methionyl-tRNA formyltransferase [Firmicutes bacterium]|uniref:Methionyl-tRNA formyltransferase n=1 Tax=Candidatus Scybalomonas excrementavium TaxID=2840943 RepID=A0A9D9HYR3_9FIRM|nr:methionyl-tRNA formyltransferase [Candidatus Scybalomonas excrementavium]
MRVVFMGTPDFAVPTLQNLIEHHTVLAVVTQPDKRKGRGKAMQFTPVKEKAIAYNIPIFQPQKVRGNEEFLAAMEELNPDIIVVAAFGQILPESILNLPKFGCINVHASLLPKYRGAGPIQWAVINGEKESGITIMYMEKGLDTGDMLKKVVVPLDPKETGESLHNKLCVAGNDILLEAMEEIENGTIIRKKQDDSLSTYAPMLDKAMGEIDWKKDAKELERLIRGLYPWPSAYTHFDGKTMKVFSADVVEHEGNETPGTIVEVTKDSIIVKAGKDCLALKEVQLEGKKRMEVKAFLLGYTVEAGSHLGKKS